MQYAVLEALEKASDYPDILAKEFHARCNLIVDRLNAMPGVECHRPKGSIYVFPKIKVPGLNSQELAMELLKDGVLCSPGTAFGPSGRTPSVRFYNFTRRHLARHGQGRKHPESALQPVGKKHDFSCFVFYRRVPSRSSHATCPFHPHQPQRWIQQRLSTSP